MAHVQDCATFPHLAATFMIEIAAGHLSVVVAQTTCLESRRTTAQESRG